MPFDDGKFDLVLCCDVLEHVGNVGVVVDEAARILKPGGVFLYDTINRTWLSRIVAIELLQEWAWLRIVPRGLHDWEQFITPKEMEGHLRAAGLESRHMAGLAPAMGPVASIGRLIDIRKLKRGEMTYAELGQKMAFSVTRGKVMNYIGYAVKMA